jgi:DNA-binding transcriptional LysR family regulator
LLKVGALAKDTAIQILRTQPAVSQALRKPEEEIDAQIFDRSRRQHYTLTELGETLYDYAERMLEVCDEALLFLDNQDRPQSSI